MHQRAHDGAGALRARREVGVTLLAVSLARPGVASADDVVVQGDGRSAGAETRARSSVTRVDIEERLPRSAPDALRFEPGVFVQQTSHGQGAPMVRGRYGARVLVIYDGVRVNNSTFRQGPNQYFFTLDAQTIDSVEVLRGGASTLFGTDALGGALLTNPRTPQLPDEGNVVSVRPRARVTYRSADDSKSARVEADASAGERLSALVGAGYTTAGLLQSAGSVRNPANGRLPEVPRFADDGVTQLGTGYRIATLDGISRYALAPGVALVAAANAFRQYDTPRTDQCPPPFGLLGDCTTIDEQFRTLAYVGLDGDLGALARVARLRLSYQRQHERRIRQRPISSVENGGRDDVDTIGASLSAQTASARLGDAAALRGHWGADVYRDALSSSAWTTFTDTGRTFVHERGQYIEGSSYLTAGAFARAELLVARVVTVVAGGRGGLSQASAPRDPEGGAPAISTAFPAAAGELRAEVRPSRWLTISWGVDRSFRAPNLDELSSRQQTGPGFQIDNPSLSAETQLTTELGATLDTGAVRAELWGYRSRLDDGIERAPRSIGECPPGPAAEGCASSWSRFEVVNAPGPAFVHGLEGALRLRPAPFVKVQATFAYTHGEGPNLGGSVPWGQLPNPDPRVPLSRVPPPNGTVETRFRFLQGAYAGWALRWALAQTRLSVADRSDYRIPAGGTPGYAVFDLRAGYRMGRALVINAVLENMMNRPYRAHGSGVNGAGRGVMISLEAGW